MKSLAEGLAYSEFINASKYSYNEYTLTYINQNFPFFQLYFFHPLKHCGESLFLIQMKTLQTFECCSMLHAIHFLLSTLHHSSLLFSRLNILLPLTIVHMTWFPEC